MAESATFEWACRHVESRTNLSTLQARGVVRLALKRAGLGAETLSPAQLRAVAERLMVAELQRHGIAEAERVASGLAACPDSLAPAAAAAGPEAFFRRVGVKG